MSDPVSITRIPGATPRVGDFIIFTAEVLPDEQQILIRNHSRFGEAPANQITIRAEITRIDGNTVYVTGNNMDFAVAVSDKWLVSGLEDKRYIWPWKPEQAQS